MKTLQIFSIFAFICLAQIASALEPSEIIIIANKNCPASLEIANHYCTSRNVPSDNVIRLDLKWPAPDEISRADYEKLIAQPVKQQLKGNFAGKARCLVTTYGVPVKIGRREITKQQSEDLHTLAILLSTKKNELQNVIKQLKLLALPGAEQPEKPDASARDLAENAKKVVNTTIDRIESMPESKDRTAAYLRWLGYCEILFGKAESLKAAAAHSKLSRPLTIDEQTSQLEASRGHIILVNTAMREEWPVLKKFEKGFFGSLEQASGLTNLVLHLQELVDQVGGIESNAALDSELSMVLFAPYELNRWQPNELKDRIFWTDVTTMLVCRLDGPTPAIAKGLVDKAIQAEQTGVSGNCYFDQRGIPNSREQYWMALYDSSIGEAAQLVKEKTGSRVVLESTPALFDADSCPDTALYCGWYSLRKYIHSSTYVTGAVGYHIASFEAVNLRDPNSGQWCPNMLKDGITATIGAVAEPYLHAFPEPKLFFSELLDGSCLVEAYYKTLPFNSWQIILIGDPLYTFKYKPKQ